MATEAERNARLDALESAVQAYAAAGRRSLQARVDRSRQILLGRTGSERLRSSSVEAASALVAGAIDDFLGR